MDERWTTDGVGRRSGGRTGAALGCLAVAAWAPVGAETWTDCVPDVVGQLREMKHHGEVLGFGMGNAGFEPTATRHWQGIARYPRTGTPYLFVSQGGKSATRARVAVVEMSSRGHDGGRLRSNRLSRYDHTEDTWPEGGDRIVNVLEFTEYKHAGGLQMAGDVLAISLDQRVHPFGPEGSLRFYDMSDPFDPELVHALYLDHAAGDVGIVRRSDDTYLVVVGGFDGNESLSFLEASGQFGEIGFAFETIGIWKEGVDPKSGSGGADGNWPSDGITGSGYQSLNLLEDCDGTLYMVGTHNTDKLGWGADWMDVWRVELNDPIRLVEVLERHMYCNAAYTDHPCNFGAAAGLYADPDQNLILYSTEYDNDGPGGSVKMAEFRHRDRVRSGSCESAWIELYDDDHGWDGDDRSIVYDHVDRFRERWDHFKKELDGFNDKASSIRWCAPSGCELNLFEDDGYDGDVFRHGLWGNGTTQSVGDLGAEGWGDEITSLRFDGSCD